MFNLTLTEHEKHLVEQALNTSLSSLYSALYDFNTKNEVLELQEEIQACKELLQRLKDI